MTDPPVIPSPLEVEHLAAIRHNVEDLEHRAITRYLRPGHFVLEVAHQNHAGVSPLRTAGVMLETLEVLERTLRPFDAVQELHRSWLPAGD